MSIALTESRPNVQRTSATDAPRLALLGDFREEGWPSMDLCAEMLARHLRQDQAQRLTLVEGCPPFRARLQRLPLFGRRRAARNGDRLLNRLWDYPRHARRLHAGADLFHVVDHSYAQLLHALPAGTAGVYCHDLDTFRCVLEPAAEPRPRWFRVMARHILAGLQKAAVVFHSTAAVRAEIERHGLVNPSRLVHAPLGVAPEFRPTGPPHPDTLSLPSQLGGRPYVLHVGSNIPRKRIDVLLAVFARMHERLPDLCLVKVGGEWNATQRELVERQRLTDAVVCLAGVERATLAHLYRNASLVLMPSEAEGFGLPVLEALACGAAVLASDLPVFREVARDAAFYAPVGNVEAWTEIGLELLRNPVRAGSVSARVAQAAQFSWQRHAEIIADAYLGITR
jgi:glycosyltransferase involved in cell wall biosynthesis